MAYTRRSYQNIVAEVQRLPGLSHVGAGIITNTLDTVVKDICGQPWPWNYAETNIQVLAPYTTGTVNVSDHTLTVAAQVPAVWDPLWPRGMRIQLAGSQTDYIVDQVADPATILLAQTVNLGQNLVGVGYTLYWDTFQYPPNYIPGSDVGLFNMTTMYRVPKVPRYRFEMLMNVEKSMFSTLPRFYCDAGLDMSVGASGQFRMRIGPPVSGVAEYRLCYHSYPPDVAASSVIFAYLPPGADEILTLVTAAKLYDEFKMPNESSSVKAIAEGKIRLLKRQANTQTIDDVPGISDELPDSSISQWGLSIQRMP